MNLRLKTNFLALAIVAAIATTGFAQSNQPVTESFYDVGLAPPVVAEACDSCLPAPIVQECDCCQESCTRCRPRRKFKCRCKRLGCRGQCATDPCVQCPSCDGDVCKLTTKQEKEKKTCFKTEQEQICVPTVRLPWQKCCPPSVSKTRLVNRLKKHTYECETCKYKWSVVEANNCGDGKTGDGKTGDGKTGDGKAGEPSVASPPAESAKDKPDEKFEESVVPEAPKVKGAFLRPWRSR